MNVPICLHLGGPADRVGVGNLSARSGRCRSSSQVASGGFEMHLGSSRESLGKCGVAEILTID